MIELMEREREKGNGKEEREGGRDVWVGIGRYQVLARKLCQHASPVPVVCHT